VYKAFTDPDTVRQWLRETVTLEEQDGKTHMTDISVFQSVADRDGMLRSGMESGAAGSFDRLDEYLARG
jgi:uncharacterized protein YndB with AHSA1/START domain